MTRDTSDEILVSTTSQTCRDTSRFSANFRQFSAAGNEFYLYLARDHQMNSSLYKIFRDYRDISAFLRAPWRVTDELIEMVQYAEVMVPIRS